MDERKNNMMKQNKKREKQKKTQETELENISKYIKEVRLWIMIENSPNPVNFLQTIEMYTQEEMEMKQWSKQEAYV